MCLHRVHHFDDEQDQEQVIEDGDNLLRHCACQELLPELEGASGEEGERAACEQRARPTYKTSSIQLNTLVSQSRAEPCCLELLTRVWPDTAVNENNLARQISSLRRALGQRPDEHDFVVTVPGYGYRFVAVVQDLFPSWP